MNMPVAKTGVVAGVPFCAACACCRQGSAADTEAAGAGVTTSDRVLVTSPQVSFRRSL